VILDVDVEKDPFNAHALFTRHAIRSEGSVLIWLRSDTAHSVDLLCSPPGFLLTAHVLAQASHHLRCKKVHNELPTLRMVALGLDPSGSQALADERAQLERDRDAVSKQV